MENIVLGVVNISVSALTILLSIPLVRRKVRMNGIYGVRTKYSYHSDEAWYEINAYGGKQFILWSMILALVGLVAFFVEFEGHPALTMLFAFAPLLLIVPAVMSWHYGKKLNVVEKR